MTTTPGATRSARPSGLRARRAALSRSVGRFLPGTRRGRQGLLLVVVLALTVGALAFKSQIKARLTPGETITAEFAENYGLQPYISKVKMAGLRVGTVTGVEFTDAGTALVSMKVEGDVVDDLGDNPSARVAPLTILGGQYGVELSPGGDGEFAGDTIPVAQTSTPVELDKILQALPDDTRTATQGLIRGLRQNLEQGGTQGLRALLRQAPTTLVPAGTFVAALRGENPGRDLTHVVSYLQDTAAVLEARDADVDQMLADLDTVTAALANSSGALAATIDRMPETLSATEQGMTRLDGTLRRLDDTTRAIKPSLARLEPLLDELQPTLAEARPTLALLPGALEDAGVVVRQLIPTATTATDSLDSLRGPVIDRVNGPIMDYLANTWHGDPDGPYPHSGGGIQADNKMYEELAYMIVNLDRASMTQDPQGTLLNFQAGAGTSTLQPLALDEALAALLPQIDFDGGQG